MQRNVLFRLFFVVLVTGICAYYVWTFQKYLRSSSDPMDCLIANTSGVIKVNDGDGFLQFLNHDSLPLHKELFADWNLWMKWKKENPIVFELMNGQSSYWLQANGGDWVLFLPIPDRWSEDQLELLQSGIPHLMKWESCLVWSSHSMNTKGWSLMEEKEKMDWRKVMSKCDTNAPFSFTSISSESSLALDYRNGQWFGFVNDSKWLRENQPVQLRDSLLGSAMSTFWLSSNAETLANNELMKKRVFSLDTLCQCNVLDAWISWQGDQWKYQSYDGQHWVASQQVAKNPWLAMREILKDTSSKIIALKHPEWMPTLADSNFPMFPKYLSKRQKMIFISDDSLSICKAINDTSRQSWKSDFSGFSEDRYVVFQGDFSQFPSLKKFDLAPLIYPREVNLVVVKNNDNWLLRIAPVRE